MSIKPVANLRLEDVLDVSSRRTENVQMPPELFSTITQVRKTYEIDQDMALSIYHHGQMNFGMAAVLTLEHAEVYVDVLNQIYGSRHTIEDLTPLMFENTLCYFVIFAGHRRHFHVEHVNQLVRDGTYPPPDPEKFSGKYRATLYFDISAEEAIELQFNENRYSAPPLHEEAEAAWRLYRYKQRKEPKLTISAFAKSIGRRPEWVSSALRFCRLPRTIQSYVIGDNPMRVRLPFGVLVSLARLADCYEQITGEVMGEGAMHQWLLEAIASSMSTEAFGRKVSAYLAYKREESLGQISLFAAEPTLEEKKERVRRVVEQEMVRGIWMLLHYAKTVQRMEAAGVLGGTYLEPRLTHEEQERFSPGSPVRIMAEVMGVARDLALPLAQIARSEKLGYVRRLTRGHVLAEEAFKVLSLFVAAEEAAAPQAPH